MGAILDGIGNIFLGLGEIAWGIIKAAVVAVAFVVYGVYSIVRDVTRYVKGIYHKFKGRGGTVTTLGPKQTQQLKNFLDGLDTEDGGTIDLSSEVRNDANITHIAQDSDGNVVDLAFVEAQEVEGNLNEKAIKQKIK